MSSAFVRVLVVMRNFQTTHSAPAQFIKQGLTLLLFLFIIGFATALSAQDMEHRVEAEYIERFTHYIEWPVDSISETGGDPFSVCVLGENPFGKYLQQLLSEVKIKGKKAAIHETQKTADTNHCQIVFVSGNDPVFVRNALHELSSKPILTIGEAPYFAKQGGHIQFTHSDKFIRFMINPSAAEQSRLKISSRLLDLATLVETQIKP